MIEDDYRVDIVWKDGTTSGHYGPSISKSSLRMHIGDMLLQCTDRKGRLDIYRGNDVHGYHLDRTIKFNVKKRL